MALTTIPSSLRLPLIFIICHKRRPCTFGQSLWSTNCPVNFTFFWSTNFFFGRPKTNFSFFWSTNFFFGQPKTIFSCFWSTNFFFGRPNLFLVNQKKNWSTKKNEKQTGQLVDQETDQKYMDAASMANNFDGYRFYTKLIFSIRSKVIN